MCGGCNIWAESAGASLIVARYWWVARQGARAVAEAQSITSSADVPSDAAVELVDSLPVEFVDPLPELTRIV